MSEQPKGAAQTAEELATTIWRSQRNAHCVNMEEAVAIAVPIINRFSRSERVQAASTSFEQWRKEFPCGVIHGGYPGGTTCLDCRDFAIKNAPPHRFVEEFRQQYINWNRNLFCDNCWSCHLLFGERGASAVPSPAPKNAAWKFVEGVPSPAATPLIDELNRVKWMLSPHERENVNALLDDFLGLKRVAKSPVPSEAAPRTNWDDVVQQATSYLVEAAQPSEAAPPAIKVLEWLAVINETYSLITCPWEASSNLAEKTRTYKCYGCSAEYISRWPEWKLEFEHESGCMWIEFMKFASGEAVSSTAAPEMPQDLLSDLSLEIANEYEFDGDTSLAVIDEALRKAFKAGAETAAPEEKK